MISVLEKRVVDLNWSIFNVHPHAMCEFINVAFLCVVTVNMVKSSYHYKSVVGGDADNVAIHGALFCFDGCERHCGEPSLTSQSQL